jgi:hypothetical protein
MTRWAVRFVCALRSSGAAVSWAAASGTVRARPAARRYCRRSPPISAAQHGGCGTRRGVGASAPASLVPPVHAINPAPRHPCAFGLSALPSHAAATPGRPLAVPPPRYHVLCTVYCTLCTVHCVLFVHCVLCTVHCVLCGLSGFALTLVDSLDMLAVVGDYPEFRRAILRVLHTVNFDRNVTVCGHVTVHGCSRCGCGFCFVCVCVCGCGCGCGCVVRVHDCAFVLSWVGLRVIVSPLYPALRTCGVGGLVSPRACNRHNTCLFSSPAGVGV